MKEAIERVLGDEQYTTNEERVDALSKELGKMVIPKEVYNDLSSRLKSTETEYSKLQGEYNDFKQSKMTDDEKREAERVEFENQKRANAIEKSDLAVQKLLLKNGIEIKDEDTELKETLSTIISEDYDKSIKLANSFISLLNKTRDNTEKATTSKLLNETPKPIGGSDSSSSLTKRELLQKQYEEAVKNKDTLLQTELIGELFKESNNPTI